ncbi:MAG: YraN family protein [Planctomycetes bacterium]|nr:YraN family protein [Planctomycetota bacterium]
MYFAWNTLPESPRERGIWAEDRAMWHLRLRGWRICARNWIGGGGELDIVASRWKTLLICEVRFRASGGAFASIDEDKQRHLQLSSRALIKHHALHLYHPRIDALAVDKLGHIEQRKNVIAVNIQQNTHANYKRTTISSPTR